MAALLLTAGCELYYPGSDHAEVDGGDERPPDARASGHADAPEPSVDAAETARGPRILVLLGTTPARRPG